MASAGSREELDSSQVFEELRREYKNKHGGDCDVPRGSEEYQEVGNCVRNQRHSCKDPEESRRRLTELMACAAGSCLPASQKTLF